MSVDDEALRHSVTLQLEGLNKDAFLELQMFHRFSAAISSLDNEWLPEDVRVFGVDEEKSREGKPKLNVSFFVTKDEKVVR